MFALQRGFRTGYSDGYMAGYRDTIDSMSRSYNRHGEYAKADRAYNKDYGSREDFRDGYQQGFESGYDTGFDRRTFESNLPSGLKRRGVLVGENQNLATNNDAQQQPQNGDQSDTGKAFQNNNSSDSTSSNQNQAGGPTIIIPRETELIIELQEDISTEHSRAGVKFTAKVVSASEMAVPRSRAIIASSSRAVSNASPKCSFHLTGSSRRWPLEQFQCTAIEVMPIKGDNVKLVDNEARHGQSSLKSDAVSWRCDRAVPWLSRCRRPVGAAVGAAWVRICVGAVVIERGKHIS